MKRARAAIRATLALRAAPAFGLGLALGLGLGAARPVAAQRARTAVLPDTATIGDVVRAAVWVELPAGARVAFADSLPMADSLENAGKPVLQTRRLPDGGSEVAVFYPVTPWRTGDHTIAAARMHVVGAGIDRIVDVSFPRLHVASVLPADTTKQQPKPPAGVVGPDRLLWPYIVAGLLALLLLLLLLWWIWRRLHRPPVVIVAREEVLTPRERALRELDRARNAGLLETGEVKLFYSRSTDALRQYLGALSEAWGADRTTSELIPRLRVVDLATAASLARLLDRADLVKFARFRPSQAEAFSDWAVLREWVERFPEPASPEDEAQGARQGVAA
ncbi:MAG TPA: hypothetical protein VF832_12325 [Longimicrobiales bacterium]